MRTRHLAAVALLVATALPAQEYPVRPEIRPFAGAWIPTGAQRDAFKTATLVGMQAALELNRNFHLISNVGWTHGHNRFATLSRDLTWIWQYDVGFELNLVEPLPNGMLLRPFAGLGGGGRTYDYRADGVGSKTCSTGYGSLGTELDAGRFAFRLEARDYLNCFEHPITAEKSTRNDIGLSFGLAYHIR